MTADSSSDPGASVVLRVAGYPPAKSEALSMLGPGHTHAQRVVDLLRAARELLDTDPDAHMGEEPIGMRVRVDVTPGIRSDATNFLGGIADVLQRKSARGDLAHLGELVEVDLFRDDRQIHDTHLRFVPAETSSYTVELFTLAEEVQCPSVSRLGEAARTAVMAPINARLRSEWLSSVIWQATVHVGGKYTQRFATPSYLASDDPKQRRHEHVVTRKWMRAALEARPDVADEILQLAVGCNVTVAEHKALGLYDRSHFGWDRYLQAGLEVMDVEAGAPADLESFVAEQHEHVRRLGLPMTF